MLVTYGICWFVGFVGFKGIDVYVWWIGVGFGFVYTVGICPWLYVNEIMRIIKSKVYEILLLWYFTCKFISSFYIYSILL